MTKCTECNNALAELQVYTPDSEMHLCIDCFNKMLYDAAASETAKPRVDVENDAAKFAEFMAEWFLQIEEDV